MRFLMCALCVLIACTAAGELPRVGEAKPSWKDLPGVDDRQHSLSDFDGKDVVVVAVTCNHCPVALAYVDRLKEFTRVYGGEKGKVGVVAISVSRLETDTLPRMKELSERLQFNFPYLYDGSQRVGKVLGATATPQFFVLGNDRRLVYRGAFDDNNNEAKVKQKYLENAVKAVLDGKAPDPAETRARGCSIIYE